MTNENQNTEETENPIQSAIETVHHEAAKIDDILETASPVSSDAIAEGLAGAWPEPTNSKQVEAPAESTPEPAPQSSAGNEFEQDPKGRKFDPELHQIGEDGKPKRNVRGFFVSKKIGRPSGKAGTAPRSVIADDIGVENAPQAEGKDRFIMVAETYFALGINIAASFLSSEVLPESDEQKNLIVAPLADVLRKHNAQEAEPEVRLLIGCGVYGFQAYQKPTVKERFLKLIGRQPKETKAE